MVDFTPRDRVSTSAAAGNTRRRGAAEVVDDHLRSRKEQRIEDDLTNFAPDVVVLCARGIYRGYAGLRRLWQDIDEQIPAGRFSYGHPVAEGEAAMLEWQARGDGTLVEDGVDSYLVRDGRIVVQTIHYTVRRCL